MRTPKYRGACTICQWGHGGAVPPLKAPLTRAGRGGAEGPPCALSEEGQRHSPHLQGFSGGAKAPPENPFFCSFPAL
jgi:hypothetical protein